MNWMYHFDPDEVVKLYRQKHWKELAHLCSPAVVARALGYTNAMNCAHELEEGYAETLLYVLRGMYQEESAKGLSGNNFDSFRGEKRFRS